MNDYFAGTVQSSLDATVPLQIATPLVSGHLVDYDTSSSHIRTEDDNKCEIITLSTENKFNLQAVTKDLVLRALRSAKSNTATGPDDILDFLINQLAPAMSENISAIFNLSISLSAFPSIEKS